MQPAAIFARAGVRSLSLWSLDAADEALNILRACVLHAARGGRRMVPFIRRTLLGSLAASAVAPAAAASLVLTRPIPSSGEAIPLVGLGSWITFNVGNDPVARASCADVMRAFFAAGGRMIDSSAMYGSSQPVIGEGLKKLGAANVFSADKVWISSGSRGPAQIEASRGYWG